MIWRCSRFEFDTKTVSYTHLDVYKRQVVESVPAHPLPAEKASKASIIGATGALVGGCALRFLVIMAGIHADVVADATAQIFADMLARLG